MTNPNPAVEAVAAAIRLHRFWSLSQSDCECGWEGDDIVSHVTQVAIAALELTEEWSCRYTDGRTTIRGKRLVGPWIAATQEQSCD